MGKRQEIRARRRRQRMINRLVTIGLVILGGLLIAGALALPSMEAARVRATQQASLTLTPVSTIAPRAFAAPVDKTSLGDPAAPVRVDVWEDFQCPACKVYSENYEPLIIQNYVETGQVYYTYHFYILFPSAMGYPESEDAASAAMCAADQGRFWDYHDMLFANWNGENEGAFAKYRLLAFAESLGLNMDEFKTCFEDKRHVDFINEDMKAGKDLGVTGTPTIFVNGKMVVSPRGERYIPNYEEIAAYIEEALAGK